MESQLTTYPGWGFKSFRARHLVHVSRFNFKRERPLNEI
jgi:hypothetical protein